MKVYRSEEIRNIALVGHGGAGKTSLTEAILFNAGAINRMGKVDDGNTASDFTPEEVKRKITISTGVMACEYRGCKLNLLDTPGYSDFYFEVVAAAQAAESMLFVLPATAGVEVQAQVIWEDFPNLPKMVFINKMDREHADFNKTPMFHFMPKPSPPRNTGRVTMGQSVDSSAMVCTSGNRP